MNTAVRRVFAGSFGLGVITSLAMLFGFANPWLAAAFFAVALACSFFESGDKTKLQMLFASVGTTLAMYTLQFSWSAWCWVGVAICAFLVLTMKIDGGDGYGA
jgi:hypothetical protein